MKQQLISQISQVADLSEHTHKEVRQELLSANFSWSTTYSEYQSGGWKTLSLYGQSKDAADAVIRDCLPLPTDLLSRLPKTWRFLDSLGLEIMWARLALLEPNAFLWEHRDYTELNNVERLRLHIPIVTNSCASLIVGDNRIHLGEGFVWKLNPTERHGACNLGREARLHIIVDAYRNQALDQLIEGESLAQHFVTQQPVLTSELAKAFVAKASSLASLGYRKSAESYLLKVYHSHQTREGEAYDLIVGMHESLNSPEHAEYWRDAKSKFLGIPKPVKNHA